MLAQYSKEEFLNLLEDKIEKAGSPSKLAKQLGVSNVLISHARSQGSSRGPSPTLLKNLGLRAEVCYVSTGEENEESSTEVATTRRE